MEERDRGPQDLETSERMATLARASGDAVKHMVQGEHETEEGARLSVPLPTVEAIIEGWPTAPKEGAR